MMMAVILDAFGINGLLASVEGGGGRMIPVGSDSVGSGSVGGDSVSRRSRSAGVFPLRLVGRFQRQ